RAAGVRAGVTRPPAGVNARHGGSAPQNRGMPRPPRDSIPEGYAGGRAGMSGASLREAIGRIRVAIGTRGAGGLADADLLQRWLAQRDEAAFELLLWRHGPMVLGLCRRLLGDAQDAEDALQATFLVLVRKAGSIGKRASLGSWLYKVASRVA